MLFAYTNTNKCVLGDVDEKGNRVCVVLCCDRNGDDDALAKRICWGIISICVFAFGL